jgi:uncharacterized membrane protein
MYSRQPKKDSTLVSFSNNKSIVPWDLKIALLWAGICILSIYIPLLNQTFIRLFLVLPLILFIPGYLLMAALFPDSADIDVIERIVLSIGTSIVIIPLVGAFLNFSSWGIRLDPLIISLVFIIGVLAIIAIIRRMRASPNQRYEIFKPTCDQLFQNGRRIWIGSKNDKFLIILSIFLIGLLILSTALVIILPKPGEKFTEFFILGGNRTADSYPQMITSNVAYPMYIGIGNHEFKNFNYTVEVYLIPDQTDPIQGSASDSPVLLMEKYSVDLRHNETSIIPINLIVPSTYYSRIDFLLFDAALPNQDINFTERINESYRSLHMRITVMNSSTLNSSTATRNT